MRLIGTSIICGMLLLMLGATQPVAAQVPVSVDIKPQSCPNPLNTNSKGVLPVAILGTADFDVTTVDPTTVLLNGVAPIDDSLEDVSTPVVVSYPCECDTLGPDGYLDLTLKFNNQDIVAALGTISDGDVLVLTLTGTTYAGTVIQGQDCIVIIKKK